MPIGTTVLYRGPDNGGKRRSDRVPVSEALGILDTFDRKAASWGLKWNVMVSWKGGGGREEGGR